MEASRDPLAYYQVLMRRTAKQAEGSGLGLGRVLAEADMALTYQFEDGMLAIEATTSRPGGNG
jgi:hypothetical protein